MSDEVEVLEEAPDRRHAEREPVAQRVAEASHADIFVPLCGQVATHSGEDANDRKRGKDGWA